MPVHRCYTYEMFETFLITTKKPRLQLEHEASLKAELQEKFPKK